MSDKPNREFYTNSRDLADRNGKSREVNNLKIETRVIKFWSYYVLIVMVELLKIDNTSRRKLDITINDRCRSQLLDSHNPNFRLMKVLTGNETVWIEVLE